MKQAKRTISTVVVIALIFGAGYLLGSSQPLTTVQAQVGQMPPGTEDLFAPFWETWSLVQNDFVNIERTDTNTLMEAALRGMLDALDDDPTMYEDPEAAQRSAADMQGVYEGIGATVRVDEPTGGIRIVSTTEGSPARRSLRQGDVIVTIDGDDVTGEPLSASISLIRGPAGTTVMLGVLRGGVEGILNIEIERARIVRELVTYTIYDGNIGYLQIVQFGTPIADQVNDALRGMDAENLDGLILDMRGNPGGLVVAAISVASQFLSKGDIFIERGRDGETIQPVLGDPIAPTVPMVVLLDEGSASASELVGGALQSVRRAVVIGELSFGKGSIQSVNSLTNGGVARITIARFFDPLGRRIDKVGITPDIVVPWTEQDQISNPDYDPQLTEAIWYLRNQF